MFEMSVNEVPGWSVLIVPRLIGVPVAATPGLVPQEEVLTAEELAVGELLELVAGALELELELELELLLHPASTPIAIAASAAPVTRDLGREYLFMCSAFSWLQQFFLPNGRWRCRLPTLPAGVG